MIQPTLVAIGGNGDFGSVESEPINRYITSLPQKEHPRMLFIPTASRDDQELCHKFTYCFENFGCVTSTLELTKGYLPPGKIESDIMMSDVIYIGGGNTLFLYNYLTALHIDILLKQAWKNGIVLCGSSAGCIILHEQGLTDSISGEWNMIYGLGYIPGFVSPHYDGEPDRQPIFRELVRRANVIGLALDDRCAAVYKDRELIEVVSPTTDYNAYRVQVIKNNIVETRLPSRVILT